MLSIFKVADRQLVCVRARRRTLLEQWTTDRDLNGTVYFLVHNIA